MKGTMPTWPQTALICAFGALALVLGYFLSRMRGDWGPAAWAILALFVLSGTGFTVTVSLLGDATAANLASGTLRVKVIPFDVI